MGALLVSCGGSGGSKAAAPAVPCGTKRTVQYASYPGVDPNLNSLDVYIPPAVDHGKLEPGHGVAEQSPSPEPAKP